MKWGVLSQLRARLLTTLSLRNLALIVIGLAAAALAIILLDAALDLSQQARAAIPLLLGICVALGIILTILHLRRLTPKRIARLYERTTPSLGDRLSIAVELEKQPATSAVQEFLRLEAIKRGLEAAAPLKVWPVVRESSRPFIAPLCVFAVAAILIGFFGRDILVAEWPRLLDPTGDHPPYSRLHIDVSPRQAEVLYGGTVEIRATASGRPVDKLWLVAKSGTNLAQTIMFMAPDRTFFQTLANVREPVDYFVTDGSTRSRKFPIRIRYTPQITGVELTTEFPQYTGKPTHSGKLSDEVQVLPADTKVTFRVFSNRPLKEGELTLTPVLGGKPTKTTLETEAQNNTVSATFILAEPVVFSLSIFDIDGLKCTEPKQGRINILPDERPRLVVLEPGRDAVATPTVAVPVRVQAEDDYGVSRVVWLRGHNRSIEQPFSMKLTLKNGARSVESVGSFDLAKLGVRPGDVIDYYFEATDNYPKGPNLTLSRMYRLQVISKEQYDAVLRQEAARKELFEPYFALQAWLKRLAERARALESQSQNASPSDKQALADESAALEKDLAKYQEQLQKLLGTALMFDVEESFRKTLVSQETQIGQARNAFKNTETPPSQRHRQLREQLDQLTKTAEEEVQEPAQQIASVANLMSRADAFVRLAQQQAALAQLLRRFDGKMGALNRMEQMEVQEMAHQQSRIKEQLRDWMTSLPELMDKLPPDAGYDPLRKQVTDFMASVAEAKIQEDVDQAFTSLSELEPSPGYFLANSAAEKMDKLIAKCQSIPKQGKQVLCNNFRPTIPLGSTYEQIMSAMGVGSQPGNGQGGKDGYSLFSNDTALYGNSPPPNAPASGQGRRGGESRPASQNIANEPSEPDLKNPEAPGRVRLQPDAKFPLRYRELVGEYFRAIAESQLEDQ